jgi:hypothetical protein
MTALSEFINPMPGCLYRDTWLAPRLGGASRHYGCDITRLPGNKPVPTGYPIKACLPGKVNVGKNWRAGNYIQIRTQTQSGEVIVTYCHLSSFAMKKGEDAEQGALVGGAGSTGNSSVPHLHLGVRIRGKRVNPYPMLKEADGRSSGMAEQARMLMYGCAGEDVKALQLKLNQMGYGIDADGIYGSRTRGAVIKFQKKHGLIADGIAGPLTMAIL